MTDKGRPLAVIRDRAAGTGGPLGGTGGPLADRRGLAKWETRWMSQEGLWSTQEALGVMGHGCDFGSHIEGADRSRFLEQPRF